MCPCMLLPAKNPVCFWLNVCIDESEQEDHTGKGIHVRSIQAEQEDDIMRLSKQIEQMAREVTARG